MNTTILSGLKKRQGVQEIFVNIFEHCNLQCSFCWQDHTDVTGMDTIIDVLQPNIQDVISKSANDHVLINLMGGELFSDFVPDHVFADYIQLAFNLDRFAISIGKTVELNWVTNLVIDISRLESMLQTIRSYGTNTYYTTSYDPRGRFNAASRELFFSNLRNVSERPKCVSIVMTNQSIDAIMSGDSHFEWLYDNGYNIYCDFYSPEKNAHVLLPTEQNIEDFFSFIVRFFPNINPIREWIDSPHSNQMSCRRSDIITAEGHKGCCGSLVDEKQKKAQYLIPIVNISNDVMEDTYMTKKGCLQCEYFKRCSIGCFLNHNNTLYQLKNDGCAYYNTYKLIDELYGAGRG